MAIILQFQNVFRYSKYNIIVWGLIILGFQILVYGRFLTGDQVYSFRDIGADESYYTWPIMLFVRDMFLSNSIAGWSFQFGLGANLFSISRELFDPLAYLLIWTGPAGFIQHQIWLTILKHFLTFALFYRYASYLTSSKYAAALGAFAFAFSGYMMLWGKFDAFANGVLIGIAVFWGFERWLLSKRWGVMLTAITLIASINYYACYVVLLFLIPYGIFRYLSVRTYSSREFAKFSLRSIAIGVAGIALAFPIFLPTAMVALNSERTTLSIPPLLELFSPEAYASLMARFLSPNLEIAEKFHFYDILNSREAQNLYEAPQVYISLLPLILLALLPGYLNRNQRRLTYLFYILLGGMVLLPIASYIMNGMVGVSFRWMFVLNIVMVGLSTQALGLMLQSAARPHWPAFLICGGLFGLAFSLPIIGKTIHNWEFNLGQAYSDLWVIFALLTAYTILFGYWRVATYNPKIFTTILLMVVIADLFNSAKNIVDDRPVFQVSDLQQGLNFFDATHEAIEVVRKNDPTLYRFSKDFISYSWSDPIAQNFFGTSSYLSLNNQGYMNFLGLLEMKYENDHVVRLPPNEIALNSLVGVKYLLSHGMNVAPMGYTLFQEVKNIKIYRNKNALPLAFVYRDVIPISQIQSGRTACKIRSMLEGAILSEIDLDRAGNYGIKPLHNQCDRDSMVPIHAFNWTGQTSGLDLENSNFPTQVVYTATTNDPKVILRSSAPLTGALKVSMTIESDVHTFGQLYWTIAGNVFSEQNSKLFPIQVGRQEVVLDIGHMPSSNTMSLDVGARPGKYSIENFKILGTINPPGIQNLINSISRLKDIPVQMDMVDEAEIHMRTEMDRPGLVFTSIPFDPGWHVSVDGQNVSPMRIHDGFVGIPLLSGRHEIIMKYSPPGLIPGIFVGFLALLGLPFLGQALTDRSPSGMGHSDRRANM